MRLWAKLANLVAVVAVLGMGQAAFAGVKTLIEMDGGKVTPGLAKSWNKVKDGEYHFALDTSMEIGKDAKVTPEAVNSLESKLGASYGVKVTPQGSDAVDVSYTGAEQQFLEELAKTKIRPHQDTEVALASNVSEGGIRAKKTDRPAGPGEVKGIVLKLGKGSITAKVIDSKASAIKSGQTVTIKGEVKNLKKNDKVFFKPQKQMGNAWVPQAGTLQ